MRSRSAAGLRLILGLGFPLGRPRCEARISLARFCKAYSIVGSVSPIRVSSVTRPPSSNGTLKSTRMKMRLSRSGKSLIDSLVTLQSFLADEADQVTDAAGIAPFIVIPGDHLHTVSSDHPRQRRVDDGRAVIAAVVHRDQLIGFVAEDSFHLTVSCCLERAIDLLGRRLLFNKRNQIDDRDVRRGHSHRKPVKLALEIGNYEVQSLGCSC